MSPFYVRIMHCIEGSETSASYVKLKMFFYLNVNFTYELDYNQFDSYKKSAL